MASSTSSSQITSIPNSDLRRLFTVIARPRNSADDQLSSQMLAQELAHELSTNGITCSVTFVGPNYIISSANLELQAIILSWSPFNTINNTFDFTAWSREDEDAQLPWIIDNREDNSCIEIDALAILPKSIKHKEIYGNLKLKDNFAKMMDRWYDLKEPDFSYLVINELKQYYAAKHAILILCKKTVIQMVLSMQELLPLLQTADTHMKAAAAILPTPQPSKKDTTSCHYIGQISAAILMATDFVTQLASIPESLSELCDVPINLEGYKELPPLFEFPVPPSYVTRLQTIHRIATKYVYQAEGIVGTIKSGNAAFQAYIKIGEHIHKYDSIPMKNEATAQMAAIYESLKYITNVLGFKILDYNYPTLQLVVSAIRRNNVSINMMQSFVNSIVSKSQSIYEGIHRFPPNIYTPYQHTDVSAALQQSVSMLTSAVKDHHHAVTTLFHRFMDYKRQFLTTFLNTQSPTVAPSRWIEVDESNIQ